VTTEKTKDGVRITNQFRAKRAMVYEFKCEGAKLAVHVIPRENADDGGEWRVEARTGHAAESPSVSQWGATRADALREVGLAWASQEEASGWPHFDWEAVTKALTAVRAL